MEQKIDDSNLVDLELFNLIKERMSKAEYDWEDLKEIKYLGYIIVLQFQTPSGEFSTRGQIEIIVYNHNRLIEINDTIEHEEQISSNWKDLQSDEYYNKVYTHVMTTIDYLNEEYNTILYNKINSCKIKIEENKKLLKKLNNEIKLKDGTKNR